MEQMKQTLIATIVAAVMAFLLGCGKGESGEVPGGVARGGSGLSVLSKEAFRDRVFSKLKKSRPELHVTLSDPLGIVVATADGGSVTLFLDNAFGDYIADNSDLDPIIDQYLGTLYETLSTSEETSISLESVVPIVRSADYPKELINLGSHAKGTDSPYAPYYEPLNDHLVMMYAEDREKGLSYLSTEDVEELGLVKQELLKTALKNVKEVMGDLETHGEEGTYLLTAGGNYESTLLLMEWIWSQDTLPVKGEYVVALPSRDVLMVTGHQDKSGMEKLKRVSKKAFNESSYRISPVLFLRDGKQWKALK